MFAPPDPARPIEVFYSYSHKDETLRDELLKHLSLLKRQGVILDWHDRKIEAGDEWRRDIDKHLQTAQIILLLVSADFLASDYCYEVEMNRALDRHEKGEAQVIPIILRSVDWTGAPFAKLQALPKDAKPVASWDNQDEAFENIAKGIRRVAESLRTSKAQIDAGTSIGKLNDSALVEEGLFLTRFINPQERGSAQTISTVWLDARGPHQYFVDSIRILSQPATHIFGSSGQVAVPPDAEYKFTYQDRSERVEALNPALSIGPETRRQASFTLSTAPTESMQSAAYGTLILWLLYHTSDGRTGTLLLKEAYPEGLILSRLLNQAVKVVGRGGVIEEVLVPPGISRGIDDQTVTAWQYDISEMSLHIPWLNDIREEALSQTRKELETALRRRAALQQAVVGAGSVGQLVREAAKENLERSSRDFILELCGAIGDAQCTQTILDLLADRPFDEALSSGLCVRHVVHRDGLLADQVIAASAQINRANYSYGYPPRNAAIATVLACYPVGRWLEALLALCDQGSDAWDEYALRALRALRSLMNAEEQERVTAYCWQYLRQREASYHVVNLLVEFTGSAEEVGTRLRELPYEPTEPTARVGVQEEMKHRQERARELLKHRKEQS